MSTKFSLKLFFHSPIICLIMLIFHVKELMLEIKFQQGFNFKK
jgi:hypothetical protein